MVATPSLLVVTALLCSHHVKCQDWSNGLRISDGEYSGRLEFEFAPSDWRTICDPLWSWENSAVACRQMSLGPPLSHPFVPEGSPLPILERRVLCSGSESSLGDCRHFPLDINCSHFNDVTVSCTPPEQYKNYDIVTVRDEKTFRLFGLLPLLYYNDRWYTTCDTNWQLAEVSVMCQQLGFDDAEFTYTSDIPSIFKQFPCLPISILSCVGAVNHLEECTWYAAVPPDNPTYLHITCSIEAVTEIPQVSPTQGPTEISYGLITFGVLAACLVIGFLTCKVCQSEMRSSSERYEQEQVRVVSVRSLEERDNALPYTTINTASNDVQELPNDLPPTYEQYVTNPRLFRSMSEQSDVLYDLQEGRVESPPPDYRDATFLLSVNDPPGTRINVNGLEETPAERDASSEAVPMSPPPDYTDVNLELFAAGNAQERTESENVQRDGSIGSFVQSTEESIDSTAEELNLMESRPAPSGSNNVEDTPHLSAEDNSEQNGVISLAGDPEAAQEEENDNPRVGDIHEIPDDSDDFSVSSCTTSSTGAPSGRGSHSSDNVSVSLDGSGDFGADNISESTYDTRL